VLEGSPPERLGHNASSAPLHPASRPAARKPTVKPRNFIRILRPGITVIQALHVNRLLFH
jgi:hypothetical protein